MASGAVHAVASPTPPSRANCARGMLQIRDGSASHVGGRQSQPREARYVCDQRSLPAGRCLPDGERRLAPLRGVRSGPSDSMARGGRCAHRTTAGSSPQRPRERSVAMRRVLIAAGMAVAPAPCHPLPRADREARLAILMRRAARHPCCARAVSTKCLSEFGGIRWRPPLSGGRVAQSESAGYWREFEFLPNAGRSLLAQDRPKLFGALLVFGQAGGYATLGSQ